MCQNWSYNHPLGVLGVSCKAMILSRQDVEISTIRHPSKDQPIPILNYQGQTFKLVKAFGPGHKEEAVNYWRDLTDNRGKACVLLQEPDRHSIWGKIQLAKTKQNPERNYTSFTQACLLIIQYLYLEIEDLLGHRQAALFTQEITNIFHKLQFPQTNSPEAIQKILTEDPLASLSTPAWEEHHLITLLQELHRLGKIYFGNTNFTEDIKDVLADLPVSEQQQFLAWLKQSSLDQLWQ